MSKIYEQWRDLIIDPFTIPLQNLTLKKIISYPPAGNDIVEGIILLENKEKSAFIKIERSRMANFMAEAQHIELLQQMNYGNLVPKIYEQGEINGKKYLVLEKKEGERLSDILEKQNTKEIRKSYLLKYGQALAKWHQIPCDDFEVSKKRVINEIPSSSVYKNIDPFAQKVIDDLLDHPIQKEDNTFIHGDFHYANILWEKNDVSAILDLEYSGKGLKEQDIAWACILRPTQHFMDQIEDVKWFIEGYLSTETLDKEKLKWCLLNGYCHFYLMNLTNKSYLSKLKKLIKLVQKEF